MPETRSHAQEGDVWTPPSQAQAQPTIIITGTHALGPHPARVPLWLFIFVALALAGMGIMPGLVALGWILASLLILARLRHH